MTAMPDDIRRFLIWKDSQGKTKVHRADCQFVGDNGITVCACPVRLSAGSVDGIIQQLKIIFTDLGRRGEWDAATGSGNPAVSLLLKQYLKFIKEEQAQAHVSPKQAKPIFLTKLKRIASYISRQLQRNDISITERFVFARDQALLKLQFFAGDRASDVGRVLAQEIRILSDGSGLVFNHTFSKTLRGDGKFNRFVIKRCDDRIVCPVNGIESYFHVAKLYGIDLSSGYLFRPVRGTKTVLNESMSYSAIYERLKTYLSVLGIDSGETPHSMRAGCAVTLAMSGKVKTKDMMEHIGWSCEKTAEYYSRSAKLFDSGMVADTLAASVLSAHEVETDFKMHADFNSLPRLCDS